MSTAQIAIVTVIGLVVAAIPAYDTARWFIRQTTAPRSARRHRGHWVETPWCPTCPAKPNGHAWFCDCSDLVCSPDGGRAQRVRLHGCPCHIPSSCCPPREFTHGDDCQWAGMKVTIGTTGLVPK